MALAGCSSHAGMQSLTGKCDGILIGSLRRDEGTNVLVRVKSDVRGLDGSAWVDMRGFDKPVIRACAHLSPLTADGRIL